MSLNRKARRQFEIKSARRTKVIGVTTAGAVIATQTSLLSPTFAAPATTQVVTNCNDSGDGSLRAAIEAANDLSDLTTITFELDPNCSTITLASNLPHINEQISIQGPGAENLTIDGQFPVDNSYIIFYSEDSVSSLNISGLTLDGGGVLQSSNWNSGIVKTVGIDGIVVKNIDDSSGQSVLNLNGPNGSTITVENSLFTNNVSSGTNGPPYLLTTFNADGIFKNNTIVGNSFSESMFYTYDSLTTVSSNTIVTNDSGTGNWGDSTFSNVSLFGNIISDLEAVGAPVCYQITDFGANLFDDTLDTTDCSSTAVPTGIQNDGATAKVPAADLALGELADNGGSTETVALGDSSVAANYYTSNSTGISPDILMLETDQRGASRPAGAGFDVGSFELNGVFPNNESTGGGTTCTEKKLGTIRFAPYSAKLSKKSKKLIRAYVAKIKDSGCTTIELSAHTATTTGAAKSLKAKRIKLSKARNAAVQKYLTKQLKAAGVTVTFKKHALGAKNPVKSNKTGDGRAKNRRVVVVMKALNGTL